MTATETAIRALVALLTAAAGLPTPRRNVALDDLAGEAEQGDGSVILTALVVSDGENVSCVRMMGSPPVFQMTHRIQIDWVAAGPEGTALEDAFDAGLAALGNAVAGDLTLGGSVTAAECCAPPERGLEQWGAKNAKTAMLQVEITYTADRPF